MINLEFCGDGIFYFDGQEVGTFDNCNIETVAEKEEVERKDRNITTLLQGVEIGENEAINAFIPEEFLPENTCDEDFFLGAIKEFLKEQALLRFANLVQGAIDKEKPGRLKKKEKPVISMTSKTRRALKKQYPDWFKKTGGCKLRNRHLDKKYFLHKLYPQIKSPKWWIDQELKKSLRKEVLRYGSY